MKRIACFTVMLCALFMSFTSPLWAEGIASKDVRESAMNVAKNVSNDHYNKHSNGNVLNGTQSKDFYVKIAGISVPSGASSIKIGDTTFSKDVSFDLSVGMQAYIKLNYFFLSPDTSSTGKADLYVAFPVVIFDMFTSGDIEIGEEAYPFNMTSKDTVATILEVRGENSSQTNIRVKQYKNTSTYIVSHDATKGASEWVEILINELSKDGGLMVTKKVTTDSRDHTEINYGFTKEDNSKYSGNPKVLAFYAFGGGNKDPKPKHRTQVDYQAYLMNVGKTAKVTLNLLCSENSNHEHDVTYTKSGDNEIIVGCGDFDAGHSGDVGKDNFVVKLNPPLTKVSGDKLGADAFITIISPDKSNYSDLTKLAASYDLKAASIDVTYAVSGDTTSSPTESVPTTAGKYVASITLGKVTASVYYEIAAPTVAPKLEVTGSLDQTVSQDEKINDVTIKLAEGDKVTWTTTGELSQGVTATSQDNTYTISGKISADVKPATYTWTLTASNDAGKDSKTVKITVVEKASTEEQGSNEEPGGEEPGNDDNPSDDPTPDDQPEAPQPTV